MEIEIYVGALIEHGSDRAVFEHVIRLLLERDGKAVILANVNFSERQIDLVIALEQLTLVIEAKSCVAPISGSANGAWRVQVASGEWRNSRNMYLQTVNAKWALRDAMREFLGADVGHPSAALVFSPSIPAGSDIYSGDYKATVVGLDALGSLLDSTTGPLWGFDRWSVFAGYHRLKRINSPAEALDPQLAASAGIIASYVSAFERAYGPLAVELIHYPCHKAGVPCSSVDVVAQAAKGANLLVRGPSGCGKTLLAYCVGVDCINQGRVPIFIQGKDFEGSLRDEINREVTLLGMPSAEVLLGACRRLGRALLFVVDGYNECQEEHRRRLTRSIVAACLRYGANVIVTTQAPLERAELLRLDDVEVLMPDYDTKRAIAVRVSKEAGSQPALRNLLESVSSGLEARLVGEVGRTMSLDASRYAIFDTYIRRKLGSYAAQGIQALTHFAGFLSDRISFSLTVRDFDRISEREKLSADLLQRLHDSGLLVRRGERFSFAHELFLNVFAAESVIRRASGSSRDVSVAMRLPIHSARQVLILGAIDDHALLSGVLAEVAEASVIGASLSGQCGSYAKIWAGKRCENVFRRMRAEVEQVAFEIVPEDFLNVRPTISTLFQWTHQERAIVVAISSEMVGGRYLDPILEIVAAMDRRLVAEHQRLRETARTNEVPLRSGLFASCYVMSGQDRPAIASVYEALHSGMLRQLHGDSVAVLLRDYISKEDLSHGQVYLLLELSRQVHDEAYSIASFVPDLLRRYWPRASYHLRLSLLDAASFCSRASAPERVAIIESLEKLAPLDNVFLSSALIESLRSLGALDSSEAEYVDVVRSEIRAVLADRQSAIMQAQASGIWFAQFDHPYEGAYFEAISELPSDDKKALVVMAAQGATEVAFFSSILILELASYGDPALGVMIARWVALPPVKCVMVQDAVNCLVTSCIALARLGCPLPNFGPEYESASAEALVACMRVLYWLNRSDLEMVHRRSECAQALSVLMQHERGVSASILSEVERAYLGEGLSRLPGSEPVQVNIGEAFPEEVADICRQCLLCPERQSGYFEYFDRKRILEFAVSALGIWGDVTDIGLLQNLSDNADLGRFAIKALAELE